MANDVLLGSAIITTMIHMITMAFYTPPVMYGTFLGTALITSILNHGYTSELLKWFDRVMMVLGTGITLYLAPTLFLKLLMVVTGMLYGAAKIFNSNLCHIGAHACITFINISICIFLYTTFKNTK